MVCDMLCNRFDFWIYEGKRCNMKFYSLKKILDKKCQYNIIIGERSNGKTYGALEHMIKENCAGHGDGGLIRRWDTDFKGKGGASMFSALVSNGVIEKYTKGEWDGVYYQSQRWYYCKPNPDNDKKVIKAEKPFCYGFSLNSVEHDKSTSYPDVTTIVFDEFMTRGRYLDDEFVLFMNTLSTIIRYRDNVTIFMLGNTVNKYSPYFKEMGLYKIPEMHPGDIDVYQYGNSKLRVAVEFCGDHKKRLRNKKPSDIYFSFNNPRLNMITGSGNIWEISVYPHKPIDFLRRDIVFIYFIRYQDQLLQCEIIIKGKYNFTFVHPKTTPLQNPEKDIIFDTEASPLFNMSRKLNQGMNRNRLTRKILSYYENDKVFFSDNETGEVLRNYVQWCRKSGFITD